MTGSADELSAVAWTATTAARFLRAPDANSHKYSRGVLGMRTGSSAYPGAAALGAEAAWRTGVGLVRFTPALEESPSQFGLPSPAALVLATRPETVVATDTAAHRARTDAWLIGSGTDADHRSFAEREALLELLSGDVPVVVDAGALDLVTGRPPVAPIIITPHAGEFWGLWDRVRPGGGKRPSAAEAAAILAGSLGSTVLLKGSRTIAASPTGTVFVHGPATPWLATAGTGDVLAGILGALVATNAREVTEGRASLAQLGATAALLHDRAARIASGALDPHATSTDAGLPGFPITALNVARALPQAFASLR